MRFLKAVLSGWRGGRQSLVILAVLVGPSMMLVNIQHDATNDSSTHSYPWIKNGLQDFYLGTAGESVHDLNLILKSRVLVRLLLHAANRLTFHRVPLSELNKFIQLTFVWAGLFLIYKTARVLPLSPAWSLVAALLGASFIPWGFTVLGASASFPYDLPSFFFCSAGLCTILYRRFFWLAVVLAFGTLNKETLVFLIPAYLFAEWTERPADKASLFLQVGTLLAIFALAYEIPRLMLQSMAHPILVTTSDNDGLYPRWYLNLLDLAHFDPSENIYWIGLLHAAPVFRYSHLPRALQAIYLATPFFLGPLFIFGNFHEVRLFSDLIPLGAVATGWILASHLEPPRSRPVLIAP